MEIRIPKNMFDIFKNVMFWLTVAIVILVVLNIVQFFIQNKCAFNVIFIYLH